MKRLSHGFTLVELLVVIAVVGILATLAVLGLSRYQTLSQDAQRSAKAAVILEALEKYYSVHGEYPGCPAVTSTPPSINGDGGALQGIDSAALLTPHSPTGTANAIACQDLTSLADPDIFSYVGDGSSDCISGDSCLKFTLKYKEEGAGKIVEIQSRHQTSIATSGVPVLAGSIAGFTTANLSWNSVQNATFYTFERAENAEFTTGLFSSTTDSTSASATGLSTNTQYFFRVKANADGAYSNVVSLTTPELGTPSPAATANSNSQITINWSAVSPAEAYQVRISSSSSFTSCPSGSSYSGTGCMTFAESTATNRVITGLNTGVTYYLQVRSVASGATSDWSTAVNATTAVPVPQSVAAAVNSATQITVSWGTVSVATSYTLQYSTTSNFSSNVSTITGITTTSRAVTSLQQGTTWYFRVAALVGTVSSLNSSVVNGTTPVNTPGAPGVAASQPGAVRSCASGYWLQYPSACPNNYYATGWVTSAPCPAGSYAVFQLRGRYNSPTTLYYSGATTQSQWFLVSARSGYYTLWSAQYYCQGPNASSGWSAWSGEVST